MAATTTTFTPPAELKFSIGSTDRGMELDELLKLTRRVPNKSRGPGLGKYAARLALQKSVASRSSALRQGKFAEARTQDAGTQAFPAVKAAELKALGIPVSARGTKKPRLSRDVKHDMTKLFKLLKKVPVEAGKE